MTKCREMDLDFEFRSNRDRFIDFESHAAHTQVIEMTIARRRKRADFADANGGIHWFHVKARALPALGTPATMQSKKVICIPTVQHLESLRDARLLHAAHRYANTIHTNDRSLQPLNESFLGTEDCESPHASPVHTVSFA